MVMAGDGQDRHAFLLFSTALSGMAPRRCRASGSGCSRRGIGISRGEAPATKAEAPLAWRALARSRPVRASRRGKLLGRRCGCARGRTGLARNAVRLLSQQDAPRRVSRMGPFWGDGQPVSLRSRSSQAHQENRSRNRLPHGRCRRAFNVTLCVCGDQAFPRWAGRGSKTMDHERLVMH